MNHQQLLFYIVVPVYKAELFLEHCVNSVLNQTYSNWELILVDDGSPDKSGKICDLYAKKYEQIHVIHQVNKGQIAARTAGNKYIISNKVEKSYAVYLDSDDTLERNALDKIAKHIQTSNAEIIVYNWQRVTNRKTIQINKNVYKGLVKDKRELYKIVFTNPFYNSLCIKSIATSLIEEEHYDNFFHIRHAEDLIQSVSYYKRANAVFFTDDILYNYTININSVTQTINYNNYKIDTTVREFVWNFLKEENVWSYDDFKQYALNQVNLIKEQLRIIFCLDTTWKNKVKLLELINSNTYFNMVLSYQKYNWIIKLLKGKKYRTLFFIMKMYDYVSKLKSHI